MFKKILFIFLMLFILCPKAQARIHILIDEASEKKFPVAIPEFLNHNGNPTSAGKKFSELLKHDLKLSGLFKILDEKQIPHKDQDTNEIDFEKWEAIEVGALIKGFVEKGEDNYIYKIKLYDVSSKKMLLGKKYIVNKKNYIEAVHRFVDSLMESLTGIRGPFNSMIAASCGGKFKKSIGKFNLDNTIRGGAGGGGQNRMSPAISPNGKSVAYVAYSPDGYPEVYVDGRQVTYFKSTTITPAWTPNGSNLIIASAVHGDTELYQINLKGNILKKLTASPNIDFNPSVVGGYIVFSSERAGGLHLFATPMSGDGAAQLTYTGYQNDQPDWSPDGSKITFAGRDEGVFDVFVMEADGSNIQRITRGEGSNESPTWSPDSRYIAFSSTRGGIYVMLEDGTNQTLIEKTGGCSNLDWGPWLSGK